MRTDRSHATHRSLAALRTESGIWNGWRRTKRSFGADQLTGPGDVGRTITIGEETVIADTRESWRENVLEEATQEHHGVEFHGLWFVAIGIVAPGEGDGLAIEGEDARLEMAILWV